MAAQRVLRERNFDMKWFTSFLIVLILVGCANEKTPEEIILPEDIGADIQYSTENDAAFITALFQEKKCSPLLLAQSMFHNDYNKNFIHDLLSDANKCDEKRSDIKASEALMAWLAKNKTKETVDALGEIGVEHIVLTREMEKEIYEKGGWKSVYPNAGGIFAISRPGFSKDGSVAVIYLYHHWAVLGATGRFRIFEKEDGKWIDTELYIGRIIKS